jgi:hypothetical protein
MVFLLATIPHGDSANDFVLTSNSLLEKNLALVRTESNHDW